MALYREEAIVLRTHKLGEADRIVSLLTLGRGKVRAVVKGVRKPGSRFGARLDPTSHVSLQLYEGRNLDTVTQADTVEAYAGLRADLDALTAAISLLEVTDQVAQEAEANAPLFHMLAGALRTLAETPGAPVAPAFFWKLLSLEGFHPHLDACVRCDAADGLVALVPERGGAVCGGCAPQTPGPEAGPALDAVRAILGGRLRDVLAQPDGPLVREVERLALRAVEFHFERPLRSRAALAARASA